LIPITIEDYKIQCKKSVDKFKKILPLKVNHGGIFLSEGFSFCAMCDLFNIDVIIESGVCNGFSTDIFSSYFTEKPAICSVDYKVKDEVRQRFSNRKVSFFEGDGNKVVLDVVENQSSSDKVGIFLDGPKGNDAITLAQKCLKYDNVKFVGIHDLFKNIKMYNLAVINGEKPFPRKVMEEANNSFMFTDEDWFVGGYSWIDNNTGVSSMNSELGSYGYTIGYLVGKENLND